MLSIIGVLSQHYTFFSTIYCGRGVDLAQLVDRRSRICEKENAPPWKRQGAPTTGWQNGYAGPLKSLHAGSIPVPVSLPASLRGGLFFFGTDFSRRLFQREKLMRTFSSAFFRACRIISENMRQNDSRCKVLYGTLQGAV
jgi:hypothetical protein